MNLKKFKQFFQEKFKHNNIIYYLLLRKNIIIYIIQYKITLYSVFTTADKDMFPVCMLNKNWHSVEYKIRLYNSFSLVIVWYNDH